MLIEDMKQLIFVKFIQCKGIDPFPMEQNEDSIASNDQHFDLPFETLHSLEMKLFS